jgi:tetratricopeptide (TPR) repeat protein
LRGEYELAIASFSEARDFFRESDAPEWEAIALRGLAQTYAEKGSFDEAIEAYQSSIGIFHRVSDTRRKRRALLDLAKVYAAKNMPEDAELMRSRARNLASFESEERDSGCGAP